MTQDQDARYARAMNKTVGEADGDLGRMRATIGRFELRVLAILIPVAVIVGIIYYFTR